MASAGYRQGDLTTEGVSIRFVLILELPYDYFYGAYKSELIHLQINLSFFYIKKMQISFQAVAYKSQKIM